MPTNERLVDRFQPGDNVEISFDQERWWAGQVVRLEHPGVWVTTGGGRLWFVTNGRRIRKIEAKTA